MMRILDPIVKMILIPPFSTIFSVMFIWIGTRWDTLVL